MPPWGHARLCFCLNASRVQEERKKKKSFETHGIVTGQSVQSRRAAENVTFSVNRPLGVTEEPDVKHLALTAHALLELRCAFDTRQAHLEIKTSHSLNNSPFFNGNIFSKVYYVDAEWRHFTFQTLNKTEFRRLVGSRFLY